MSELKTIKQSNVIWGHWFTEYYIKSEADKVIADLEDRLQAANEQVENLINSASSIMLFQDRVNDNKCAELRHANYKRCEAMAKMCCGKSTICMLGGHHDRKHFYNKWHLRWLELAEHFKEAK